MLTVHKAHTILYCAFELHILRFLREHEKAWQCGMIRLLSSELRYKMLQLVKLLLQRPRFPRTSLASSHVTPLSLLDRMSCVQFRNAEASGSILAGIGHRTYLAGKVHH